MIFFFSQRWFTIVTINLIWIIPFSLTLDTDKCIMLFLSVVTRQSKTREETRRKASTAQRLSSVTVDHQLTVEDPHIRTAVLHLHSFHLVDRCLFNQLPCFASCNTFSNVQYSIFSMIWNIVIIISYNYNNNN